MKLLSQQVIKMSNLKKVFNCIMSGAAASRIELSKMTSLSKTTISALVDELIAEGFVIDDGAVSTGKQGRKPSVLRVDSERNVVAVINWRDKELEASVVGLSGEVQFRTSVPVSKAADFPFEIRALYENELMPHMQGARVLGFCLIVPSMLDARQRRMVSTTLPVPMESDVLAQVIERFHDVPVAVFNDTACYAYAECTLTQHPLHTFTFINMNKGVGAIIVQDGVMLRGEDGMRSQLGHYSLDRNGEPCICGNRGCLENEIGEAALEHRAERLGCLDELAVSGCIRFARIGRMADEGNETARAFVKGLAADLAFTLGNVVTIHNTSHIVIGGLGQYLGRYYLEQITEMVRGTGFREFVSHIEIQFSSLGDDAIMRGAARYYIDKYYEFFSTQPSLIVLE